MAGASSALDHMNTLARVKAAFYSGEYAYTGDAQTASEIAFLTDEGYLSLRIFPIATLQGYRTVLQDIKHQEHASEATGGSDEHVALKLLIGTYLRNEHGRDLKYEHPLCGYYPDVMTVDGRIVAECGHTHNPEKMLAYFKQSAAEECIFVPYPDPEEQDVLGYSFTASGGLRDFLAFWEAERYSEIKKRLRK